MRWAIRYRDGSRFTHEDGAPHEAPRTNVQAVYVEDELVGAQTTRSPRGYWVWEDVWIGTDDAGLFQHLFFWPHPLVLFGTCLGPDEWDRVKREIAEDVGVLKDIWRREEREPYAFS